MTQNLLVISTHKSLYVDLNDVATTFKKYAAYTMFGVEPNEESLNKVRDIIQKYNIKGIVTRGTWAVYIQKNINIPVFPFQQDAYDLLQNINFLIQKGYKSIFGYSYVPNISSNYVYGEIDVYNLGSAKCYLMHVHNNEELFTIMKKMVSTYKIEAAFGDCEGMDIIKSFKIPVFPFQLSSRFLISTIENGEQMLQRIEHEKMHTEYIETLTNIISECSIFTDEKGKITFYNQKAAHMFKIKEQKISSIQQLIKLPNSDLLQEQANKKIEINNIFFIMNVMPVVLYGRVNFSFLLSDTQNIEHVEMSIRRQSHNNGLVAKNVFADIVYEDSRTQNLISMAKRYAASDGTILITGESGTGKEVYANAIHNESLRRNGPFVAINCATFTENLIESELFGYEKGAFTGALSSGKKGLFELAHKGTLFLDEIGELPISMQAKLLRVLQEHEVRHIGGDKVIPVDVRIIAATNKNLRQMVHEGSFREDLFYRLSLLELSILPLRERPNDIVPLFKLFFNRLIEKSGKKMYWTDHTIFSPLLDYHWPGNIRELENITERAVLLTDKLQLSKEFIQELVNDASQNHISPELSTNDFKIKMQPDLNVVEALYIEYVLTKFHHDKDKVCNYLGISKPTLWRKLNYLKNIEY